MNPKRLILAILAGFAFIVVSDFLVHGIWLRPQYEASAALWRTDAEMKARFGYMTAAQLLCALTFIVLWARGFAESAKLTCAVMFGLFMGIFQQVWAIVLFVVMPLPVEIAAKWFVAGLAQSTLLALLTFYTYKPKAAEGKE